MEPTPSKPQYDRITVQVNRLLYAEVRRAYPFLTPKQLTAVAFERMLSEPMVFAAIQHNEANAA